jgi:hypothetical protein
MPGDIALLLVAVWYGFSLAFIVLTQIRLLAAEQAAGAAGRTAKLPTRLFLFVFVVAGAFGYAGLVGNLAIEKDLMASSLLCGGAAGVWASFLLFPRSSAKRES